jgi:hypothetical protein
MRQLLLCMLLLASSAYAKDQGQWERTDPIVREWFRTLMRPDDPHFPCCGESDAYWCDDVRVRNGHTYCKITDDREDEPLGRPHIDVGTEFYVPDQKIKWDRGNPTGHVIVFLGDVGFGLKVVICFVQITGT